MAVGVRAGVANDELVLSILATGGVLGEAAGIGLVGLRLTFPPFTSKISKSYASGSIKFANWLRIDMCSLSSTGDSSWFF